MSTRCQIRIVKNGYPLNYYHHHDGYLSGVGAELRGWLKEAGVEETGKRTEGVEGLVMRMSADREYEPTFWRHADIEFFYLLDFDNGVFRAYELRGWNPWADEGEDGYDAGKPWYAQMPRNVRRETDLLADDFNEEEEEEEA